jgi:hypothetical protein
MFLPTWTPSLSSSERQCLVPNTSHFKSAACMGEGRQGLAPAFRPYLPLPLQSNTYPLEVGDGTGVGTALAVGEASCLESTVAVGVGVAVG